MLHSFQQKTKNAFVFILIFILAISTAIPSIPVYADETAQTIPAWPQAPEVYGISSILIDADTGAVLYSKNPHEKLYPASITKIMTGLLAIENLNLNDTVTYNDNILNSLPSDASILGLLSGETTTIRDALYALMLRSANEAAVALALKISGSESAFGELMTERASQAGALNTHFSNPTGLHDENHYTTAYDMAMITKTAMSNAEFSSIWGAENYTLAPTNMSESYRIWNRHYMLLSSSQYYYSYAIGGKTGYTDQAGRTLVTAAEKDGQKLICVIMNSDDEHIFSDTKALFEYGFQNFTKVNVQDAETRFRGGSTNIPVLQKLYGQDWGIFSLSNESILIPTGISLSDIPYTLEFLEQPQNNIVATVRYEYEGNYLGQASLMMNLANVSDADLSGPQKNSETTKNNSQIHETTSINIYLLLGCSIGAILLILILVGAIRRHRIRAKRKRRRTYYK